MHRNSQQRGRYSTGEVLCASCLPVGVGVEAVMSPACKGGQVVLDGVA